MFRRVLGQLVFVGSICVAGTAYAVEVSDIEVLSYLGQPLEAQLKLTQIPLPAVRSLAVRLVDEERVQRDLGYVQGPAAEQIKFRILPNRGAQGEATLNLSSTEGMDQPYIRLYLEFSWTGGRLLKAVEFFLDPPLVDVMPVVVIDTDANIQTEKEIKAAQADIVKATLSPPAVRPTPTKNSTVRQHKSESGESLRSVARRYRLPNVSMAEMMAALSLMNQSLAVDAQGQLLSGQTVKLPLQRNVETLRQKRRQLLTAVRKNQNLSFLPKNKPTAAVKVVPEVAAAPLKQAKPKPKAAIKPLLPPKPEPVKQVRVTRSTELPTEEEWLEEEFGDIAGTEEAVQVDVEVQGEGHGLLQRLSELENRLENLSLELAEKNLVIKEMQNFYPEQEPKLRQTVPPEDRGYNLWLLALTGLVGSALGALGYAFIRRRDRWSIRDLLHLKFRQQQEESESEPVSAQGNLSLLDLKDIVPHCAEKLEALSGYYHQADWLSFRVVVEQLYQDSKVHQQGLWQQLEAWWLQQGQEEPLYQEMETLGQDMPMVTGVSAVATTLQDNAASEPLFLSDELANQALEVEVQSGLDDLSESLLREPQGTPEVAMPQDSDLMSVAQRVVDGGDAAAQVSGSDSFLPLEADSEIEVEGMPEQDDQRRLSLALVYREHGNYEGARRVLEMLLSDGGDFYKREAEKLLESLSNR